MDSFQFDYEHYVIVQKLPYLKTLKNYIPYGSNITHIKKLVNSMVGDVEIFLYTPENNSRQNLTSTFITRDFDINICKIENIVLATARYVCSKWGPEPEYFNFYYEVKGKYFPSDKFYIAGYTYNLEAKGGLVGHLTYDITGTSIFFSDLEKHKRKNNSGNSYEKFIGSKYESKDYHVEYNGIEKGVKDGGLDLIATKKDKLVLVQCKNWALSNNFKINQKDLRAFVGDCYLYLRKIDTKNIKVSFHFIVSHNDILTKTAKIFLNEYQIIKFKYVPFEKNDQ